jgi:energy-converting hydrogenase B subunit D
VIPLQVAVLVVVGVLGTAVVFQRDPVRQALVVGLYGLVLAVLFLVFQSPDVALSEIVVGTVGLPALILFALAKIEESD